MNDFSFPVEAFKSYNEGAHMHENIFKVMTITHKSCLLFCSFPPAPSAHTQHTSYPVSFKRSKFLMIKIDHKLWKTTGVFTSCRKVKATGELT